jgi:hypothetical protein
VKSKIHSASAPGYHVPDVTFAAPIVRLVILRGDQGRVLSVMDAQSRETLEFGVLVGRPWSRGTIEKNARLPSFVC